MANRVEDSRAEMLEKAGLWRRASGRWLDVMQSFQLTDGQRDWIRMRRKYCLSRVTRIEPPKFLDTAEINRAARKVQEQMGLSRPSGSAFRLPPPEK